MILGPRTLRHGVAVREVIDAAIEAVIRQSFPVAIAARRLERGVERKVEIIEDHRALIALHALQEVEFARPPASDAYLPLAGV